MTVSLTQAFSRSSWITRRTSRYIVAKCANVTPRRYVQEFPGLRMDNTQPSDHVLILPESLNEAPETNESLRLPRFNEPEIDFKKLTVEKLFKGLSQRICSFENFMTDFINNNEADRCTVPEFLKKIEQQLYPLDSTFNLLIIMVSCKEKEFNHPELYELINRYYKAREAKASGVMKRSLIECYNRDRKTLGPQEKLMFQQYEIPFDKAPDVRKFEASSIMHLKENLNNDYNAFMRNINETNSLFSHTVDDPDILAAVSDDYDDCQDLHHKERTPLQITIDTYQKFMQVCPDRYVRKMLWSTYNKRCSPKSTPKYNNLNLIQSIRLSRRKIADLMGRRNHFESKLEQLMAPSRKTVVSVLSALNEENQPRLSDCLSELNAYAADNAFDDPSSSGIQEYDVDYWTHKYMHDILIGSNESELKKFFPLDQVMKGVMEYFNNTFGISMTKDNWANELELYSVARDGQKIGSIIFDPRGARADPFYVRVRSRVEGTDLRPARFISIAMKPNAYLSFSDIVDVFYLFSIVLQRFLYNYKYYELNASGALPRDVLNMLPNICLGHLYTNQKILQSCSRRGDSKTIDSELARRILKAHNYFKPIRTSHDLYRAHLDLEAHTVLLDIKALAEQVQNTYSPFSRDPDNYDFCAMNSIFIGPNDATQYSVLWSRQLANFCLQHAEQLESGDDVRKFYGKLLDTLFSSDNLDVKMEDQLLALTGQRFEPSKASLGVL